MSWRIRLDGHDMSSDDFLLDDLDRIERATGKPWSTLNPWKSAQQAKEFLRVLLHRSGVTGEDADARLDALTLAQLKSAFDWVPEEHKAGAGAGGKARPGRTSRSGSRGARPGSGGPPPKPADSGSATST